MPNRAEPYCRASMNYSVAGGGAPATVPVEVAIHDGRIDAASRPFEDCGFELREHSLPVDPGWSAREFGDRHGRALAELAQAVSGCDRTVVYPAIVRSPRTAADVADYAPITFVHSDYTDDYRPMLESPDRPYGAYVGPLLTEAGLTPQDVVRADRVMMLQFWRNLGAALPDYPLAFCDARSVGRAELLPFVVPEYGGARLDFETFGVRAPQDPSTHDWYTFPRLAADEVVMFRTYDSRCVAEERPFWTPHSAFRDPHAGPEAAPRASVEIRVLCVFGGR